MTSDTAPTSIGARPPALPAEPNAFVGRERDLADLRRLLSETRAVTLCGPGGIGKTRLAVRVARALAGDQPDGVWFIELADVGSGAVDLDPVARRVADVLGLADETGRAPADFLADALRRRRALVVLDNCEHLVEECASLCRTLLARCDRLRILATSREPLRVPGENVWRVPPLSFPAARDEPAGPARHEAVRLFMARATAARPDFALTPGNAPALAELCRALDGVPLALELAAARVRVLSLEQIADRLTDRFRLLTAGDRTAPPRQRTLRAAIDWSHELLDEPERILLRRLSVFAGWSLDQAEQVCADGLLPQEQILDLLTALVDKSLVVVDREVAGETRFRLLESIREYAVERLAEAGEEQALRGRHRAAVLELLEHHAELGVAHRPASWRRRVELYDRYDVEQHNVRVALAWSRERGDVEEGLRLCLAARLFWGPRGHYAEAAKWSDWFLERGGDADPRVLGPALVGRAQLAVERREFDVAETCARAGLEHCRAVGDARTVAAGLGVLVHVAMRAGEDDRALALAEESLSVARAQADPWNEGLAQFWRGVVLLRGGRLREAEAVFESGAALMRDLDQLWGVSLGRVLLGALARTRGDQAGARRHFEEALPPLREIGARPLIMRSLNGLGRCALAQGDLEAARRALEETLRLGRAIGLRAAVACGLEAFAELLVQEGDESGALLLGGAAAALRERIGPDEERGCPRGPRVEGVLEPARRRLGEQRVAQLWGEGRALSADDAVAYALERQAPGRTAAAGEAAVPSDGAPASAVDADRPAPEAPAPPPAAPVTPPGMLTPREREIAQLIARGLSNRGIADELVISPATVARHVTNILTKLGFGSRAQIAAWAVDNIAGAQ